MSSRFWAANRIWTRGGKAGKKVWWPKGTCTKRGGVVNRKKSGRGCTRAKDEKVGSQEMSEAPCESRSGKQMGERWKGKHPHGGCGDGAFDRQGLWKRGDGGVKRLCS